MSRSLEDLIRLACQAEVLAHKPGNVHPGAAFDDLTAADFLMAAEAVARILSRAAELGVGRAIYEAVVATKQRVATNANLGICLLMAPCAAAFAAGGDLRGSLRRVLDSLSVEDARWAYQAIRAAAPGGLGQAGEQDVADEPTVTLLEAMRMAADRDDVARQYATDFHDIFEVGLPAIREFAKFGIETAIVGAHLRLMSARPDTLIARKCGVEVARESASRATTVIDGGWPVQGAGELKQLDAWLRADGHRRNPGTTADLVAVTIFVVLVERTLSIAETQAWCEQRLLEFRF